jgi:hypothetical protein
MPINSLEEFFALVEKLPEGVRDKALQMWYVAMVRGELPQDLPAGEDRSAVAWTLLRSKNTWTYGNFKEACRNSSINQRALVQSIVSVTASWLFVQADESNAAEKKLGQLSLIEELDAAISANQKEWPNMSAVFVLIAKISVGGLDSEQLVSLRDSLKEQNAVFDQTLRRCREEYELFCATVIAPLIESDLVRTH